MNIAGKKGERIKIREADYKDASLIMSFIKELAEYEKLADSVVASENLILENIFGERKYAEVIIAEYNDEPAGQALFFHNFSTFLGKPGIYLEDLYVRPHLRGNGIGKALLQYLVNIAKERKCGRIEWAVLDWNTPAIEFYKSMGAVLMKDWTIFRLTEDKYENFIK
ncbi:MAG TPA: GNAT family N-acetyltransferase [Ignavibacteriaceae bacterium]|nr:GNAT family N-acetyltransferase [Ignavibacteriaceae bacterium]